MRILLVDDDARLRWVMRQWLLGAGYFQVEQAADGQEALALLHERPADLILADLHMPRMDGMRFLRSLRQGGDRTPLIMLTSRHDRHRIVPIIRGGAENYLSKPLCRHMLIEKVQQTAGLAAALALAA
jgi:CheY-like chemotaxis protein